MKRDEEAGLSFFGFCANSRLSFCLAPACEDGDLVKEDQSTRKRTTSAP